MSYEYDAPGLEALEQRMRLAPKVADQAAMRTINYGADLARRESSKQIRSELNFTAGYLNSDDRLAVVSRATSADGEAVLRARDRPTSLARFRKGPPQYGRRARAVRVKVGKRGGTSVMDRAFDIRLRRGNSGELGNDGIAVRLRPGETLENKRSGAAGKGGFVVLYGPSVGQAARGVFDDILPGVSDDMRAEFARLFEVGFNG